MSLSRIVYPGDGITKQWAIPFALGYLEQSDVTARVGDAVDGAGNPVYRTLTFLSPTLVEVSGAAAAVGQNVVFDRTVQREQLVVDFEDGDIMNEENLNQMQRQLIMLVHEVMDGRFESLQGDIFLSGFRIKQVGNPIDPQDVATKAYVDGRITYNENISAAAIAARDAAIVQANAAAASASTATTARDQSVAARNTAVAAADSTAGSVTAAAGSASAAATSATNAQSQRAAAEAAATVSTNASGSASAAATLSVTARDESIAARNMSQGYSTTASTAATNAVAAESGAAASAINAAAGATDSQFRKEQSYRWAMEAEDTPVDDGEHQGFSAYHWAQKAAGAVSGGTVSSVGVSMPTGFAVSNSPITSSGVISIGYAAGYVGFTTAQATKLGDIQAGATANDTDANLKNRANHTGVMPVSALDAAVFGAPFVVGRTTGSGIMSTMGISSSAGAGTVVYRDASGMFLVNTATANGQPVPKLQMDTAIAGITKTSLGLGNVDNTSDANKPISIAQAARNTAVDSAIAAVATTANGAVQLSGTGQVMSTAGIITRTNAMGNTSGVTQVLTPGNGQIQSFTNNGAGTLSAPTAITGSGALIARLTVASGAGALTLTGWTITVASDPLDLTVGSEFLLFCVCHGGGTYPNVMTIIKVA